MRLSRREALKLFAASALASSIPITLGTHRARRARLLEPGKQSCIRDRVAYSACLICGQRCPLKVYVRDVGGRPVPVRVVHNTDVVHDEYFATCGRPQLMFELQYLHERIRKPLIRAGKRGEGRFKEISWDEALNILAEKVKKYLNEPWRIVVVAHQGCEAGIVRSTISKATGTPNTTLHCDTCHGGLDHGNWFVFGAPKGPAGFQPDYVNAKLVVLMGRNPLGGVVASAWTKMFTEARSTKTKIIVFDVRESRLTEQADEYYIIPPGTDLAISLAILNVLLTEGLYNRDYLVKWTNASMLMYTDSLEPVELMDNPSMKGKKTYLVYDEATKKFAAKTQARKPSLEYKGEYNGRPVKTALMVLKDSVSRYTPEWASRITGVPASTIRRIAHELANAAPKAFIDHGYKAARYYNEGMLKRVNMLINVLLGSVGVVGGLAYPAGKPHFKDPFSILGLRAVEKKGTPIYKYWEEQGVVSLVESKCWSQLLVRSIIEGKPYPIGVLIIDRENLVSHAIGGRKLAEALRDERRVEFIVVMDTTFNETTMYADLVLPVPYFFEYESITLSFAKKSYISIVTDLQKVVDPPPGVDPRPEWWILVELLKRLGKLPESVVADPLKIKAEQARSIGADYTKIRSKGYWLIWTKPKYHPWGGKPLPTTSGEIELINIAFLSKFRDYLGKEHPLNPLPVWIPPLWMKKTNGRLGDNEFIVVEFQDSVTAVNTFVRFSKIVTDALEWRRVYGVQMHPERAKKLGLRDGDMVRVKGPNGEVVAKVIVTDKVHPYVLAAPHATAFDEKVVPRVARIETSKGVVSVRLFSNGGGYGMNNNFLADPFESVVPDEGYRAAQHDFIARVEKV